MDKKISFRETPPSKTRAAWLRVCASRQDQKDLREDFYMERTEKEVRRPSRQSWLVPWWDRVGLWFCGWAHPVPRYEAGNTFYICPHCLRKYATPWANPEKMDPGIYCQAVDEHRPTVRTKQAC